MTGEIWSLFGTNLLVMVVVMTLVAIPSFRTKDPSYIDAIWGSGFVVLAISSFLQTDGDAGRKGLLLGLCALWGLRLSTYLLLRWRRHGPDPRYVKMLGPDPAPVKIWARVFLLQAVILTVVAVPVQLGQVYADDLHWWNYLGAAVALFGIGFEALADRQLKLFKDDPANAGQVMDKGLWHNTRHPNYFGESVTWWGLGLVAWSNAVTVFALLGPVLITLLLLKVSGVGLLESAMKKSKPKYVDYIASTSAFVPLPKRDAAKVRAEAGV